MREFPGNIRKAIKACYVEMFTGNIVVLFTVLTGNRNLPPGTGNDRHIIPVPFL